MGMIPSNKKLEDVSELINVVTSSRQSVELDCMLPLEKLYAYWLGKI